MHLPPLPLTGRDEELASLSAALAAARDGSGQAIFLRGETGIGKSRLLQAVEEGAEKLGFFAVRGQAYRTDKGVPYGLWSDAFLPALRDMDDASLAVLTRGGAAELSRVLPGLGAEGVDDAVPDSAAPGELRTRIHWIFSELLSGLGKRAPLLVTLDDIQWSDPSGLELLHFVTRHLRDVPVLLICAYNTEHMKANPAFTEMEDALLAVSGTSPLTLKPLTRDQSVEMILNVFQIDVGIAGEFAERVHERSGGNPYFIQEILELAISRGHLHIRDRRWLGWDVDDLDLPTSVSEAVSARIGKLSAEAREVANILAVSGTRTDHRLFGAASDLPEGDLLAGVDELRARQLIEEAQHAAEILYRFSHPLIQEVLYAEMGLARARSIHRRVGDAMERGEAGVIEDPVHALAYHFSRAGGEDPRVVRYLWEAGRKALESRANREAIGFLREAVERARSGPIPESESSVDLLSLVEDLARSLQRAGEYRDAAGHWRTALDLALERGDDARAARLLRRIGQAAYFPGRYAEAMEAYEKGLAHAEAAGERAEEAHLRLHMGIALQAQGGANEAREEMERARAVAEAVGDPGLLARVHRGLMILHTWLGNMEDVREHGREAITLSEEAGDRQVTFWVYWQLAVSEGFLGHTETMNGHIQHCRKLAEELRSPVLELWTSEVLIEHAAAAGRWDTGIALGEQAVARARALGQDALLPRLNVFLGLIYLGRGELELGKACVEEAWTRSGAAEGGVPRVHLVVPAHMGMAAYHLAVGKYEEAIRIGEAGLKIAENTGYIIWAVHRLLPVIGEAYLELQDASGAAHIEERMRPLQ